MRIMTFATLLGIALLGTMALAQHVSYDYDASGFGGPRFGNVTGMATTQKVVSGTLVVDMMDARTRAIVWRGFAERDLNPTANPEKREKNITKAAEKIFKNYPPES